jgi:hypothetical protein
MLLTTLIPKIFYSDINIGLGFFVEGLGFKINYQHNEADEIFYIIQRDNIVIQIVENDEFAKKDRPELRIVTDDIQSFYEEIKDRNSNLLHPNLNVVKKQPWGLTEFALLDESGVCIIIQNALTK